MVNHPNHQHPLSLIGDTRALYPEYNGQWQCDVCEVSYDNQHQPYHCDACKFDMCLQCLTPRKHPMHTPNHDLYLSKMTSIYPEYRGEWKCDGCHRHMNSATGKHGYHCFLDQFDLCSDCYNGRKYAIHMHPLKPANARIIYENAPGLWVCDVCQRSGVDMMTEHSWHCTHCEFDVCEDCLLFRANIPEHQHQLEITDAREIYPQHGGNWECDICHTNYQPGSGENNGKPYHCRSCEYDACHRCISQRVGNRFGRQGVGRDMPGPPPSAFQQVLRAPQPSHHHQPPTEFMDDDGNYENLDDSEKCIVCYSRPKNATIVHGNTGHICCCLPCAYRLESRGDPCPICRAPIDRVIKQFTS